MWFSSERVFANFRYQWKLRSWTWSERAYFHSLTYLKHLRHRKTLLWTSALYCNNKRKHSLYLGWTFIQVEKDHCNSNCARFLKTSIVGIMWIWPHINIDWGLCLWMGIKQSITAEPPKDYQKSWRANFTSWVEQY